MTDLHPDKLALFNAIAHGDEDHRAWLKEAIEAHFAGQPAPEPRGKGNKEAKIKALQARLDAVRELIEQGYRGVNKTDQCEHGKYGFEDCIACYDEALMKALNGERM